MLRFAAIVAIALLLVPSLATAQTTGPVGTVSDDETSVSRAYEGDAASGTFGIFALGSVSEMESQAIGLMRTMPPVIASGMSGTIEDAGAIVETPEQVPVTAIGDQSTATRVPYTMFGSVEGELVILAVRQATWVQVLVGFGLSEADHLPQLERLARQMLSRWPATEPVTVRPDGLRTGGIWAMMPLPEDVPAGYTVDPDIEEGPGPGTVAPTAGGPAAETPASDLPLLPTSTPPAAEIPPASAPSAPTPPPAVATPAPNPRLALPFDVTVEIFLPLDLATVEDDGSCHGDGLLDGLDGDGQVTLRAADAGDRSATAQMAGPGQVALDRETGQEICYFRATLTDVPARARYTLLAGETVLGRYTYDELTATGSILIVLGEDD